MLPSDRLFFLIYGFVCIPIVSVLAGVSFWRLRRANGLGKELFGVVGAWAVAAQAVPVVYVGLRYGGLVFALGLGLLVASPFLLGWAFYRVVNAPTSESPWSLKQLISFWVTFAFCYPLFNSLLREGVAAVANR